MNTQTIANRFRIVGGREAALGEFPWQVSLLVNGAHFCGASIISKQWILTAAHCLDNVIAGSNFRMHASKYGTKHKPIKVLLHPRYNKATTSNDVAVVKVSPEFSFRNHSSKGRRAIGSVCLPSSIEEFINRTAIVSGFGRLKHNSVSSIRLMAVKLNVLKNSACASIYKFPKFRINSNVCYGTRKGRKGSCKGDSGGPVTVIDNNRVKLIAVVSYGMSKCASAPSVGAKVSYFRRWIKAKTGI